MQQVKIDNDTFDVDINGAVYQPRKVPSNVLDSARLLASNLYLGEKLSKEQREYWRAVSLTMPEGKRFRD